MSNTNWFQVDRSGLAAIARRRGMAFVITEPIQNAWDENTTEAHVTLEAVPGRSLVDITVTDDSPEGFADITDSFMMFRSSRKLADPEKRGRFNIGEKLLLATAITARVMTTSGSVIFDETGRRRGRKKTEAGSILTARLKMTREELDKALAMARTLIPPEGITTYVNGEMLPKRTPVVTAEHRLDTEVRGEEGGFKFTTRKCEVRVYPTLEGETAHLYEMGIPIDELDCPWHVEVAQKVPMSVDRASVRYGYLTTIKRIAAEMMSDCMTAEVSRQGWVGTALCYMEDDEAVRAIVTTRFGEKAVTFDPSSPEANKRAVDQGYTLVHGGELSKSAWMTIRRAEALEPAGKVFATGVVETSSDGTGIQSVPRGEWSKNMERLARYAGDFAAHVTENDTMQIEFYDDPMLDFYAFCGQGKISFNMGASKLNAAVLVNDQEVIDELLIHECAHAIGAGDHLSDKFHKACCRIGAKARSFYGVL